MVHDEVKKRFKNTIMEAGGWGDYNSAKFGAI